MSFSRFITTKRLFAPFSTLNTNLSTIPIEELQLRRDQLDNLLVKSLNENEHRFERNLLVIFSSLLKFKTHHVPHKFVPNSYFYYLTGIKSPKSVYISYITNSNGSLKSERIIFIDSHDEFRALWEGPSLSFADVSMISGINNVEKRSNVKPFLQSCLSKANKNDIVIWKGQYTQTLGEDIPHGIDPEIQILLNEILFNEQGYKFADPFPLIDKLRVKKSPYEILCLKKATAKTSEYFAKIMQKPTDQLLSESSIANEIEYLARKSGCELGYPPVVAGGKRANIIHYLDANKLIYPNELVLVDSGCKYEGYTADITRTWPISKKFSRPQRILHEILELIQKECASLASPDVSLDDLYKFMLSRIIYYLVAESVISKPDSPFMAASKICPHHIGHYIGLDIHDTPSISYQRKLEPGVSFPLEPGIYFPVSLQSQNLGVSKDFLGLGLRLEDDYFIETNGEVSKLCNTLPSSIKEIEAFINK